MRIFDSLSARNGFSVYRLTVVSPIEFLNPLQHAEFIEEGASLARHNDLLNRGHFYCTNFRKHGFHNNRVCIILLRDPLERLISKYYSIRYGDD